MFGKKTDKKPADKPRIHVKPAPLGESTLAAKANVFQPGEFPAMVYKGYENTQLVTRLVENPGQLRDALDGGWSESPG